MLSLPVFFIINRKISSGIAKAMFKIASFIALYTLVCFAIVPPIAKHFGRVRLQNSAQLKPATFITRVLNRDYVTPAMQKVLNNTAETMHTKYGITTYYLDANFPFIKGFPLFPHLSHNDGKKVDLAFYYTSASTGKQRHGSPSAIGYGVGEPPLETEVQQADICQQKGYWQYSFIHNTMNGHRKQGYVFDEDKTKQLITLLIENDAIGKLFIEPHLVQRLKLNSGKVKFQGCHSVRHDDHIHIQLK